MPRFEWREIKDQQIQHSSYLNKMPAVIWFCFTWFLRGWNVSKINDFCHCWLFIPFLLDLFCQRAKRTESEFPSKMDLYTRAHKHTDTDAAHIYISDVNFQSILHRCWAIIQHEFVPVVGRPVRSALPRIFIFVSRFKLFDFSSFLYIQLLLTMQAKRKHKTSPHTHTHYIQSRMWYYMHSVRGIHRCPLKYCHKSKSNSMELKSRSATTEQKPTSNWLSTV